MFVFWTRVQGLAALCSGLLAVGLCAGVPARGEPPAAGVRLTAIAQSGETAPGTELPFVDFGSPLLNDAGQVVLEAALSVDESGRFGTFGIWGPTSGLAFGLAALEGEPTPDGSGERFSTFSVPFLADAGRLGFVASRLDGGGAPIGDAIFAQLDGRTLQAVARVGGPAPGTGSTYTFLATPLLHGRGRVAFRGAVRVTSGPALNRDGALWSTTTSGLSLLAREGDPAVDSPGDAFDDPLIPLGLSAAGDTYFEVGLNPDGSRIAPFRGLYRADAAGVLQRLTRTPDPAFPGLPPGEVLAALQEARFNDRGDFTAVGVIVAADGSVPFGVFVVPAGGMPRVLARSGQLVPGTNLELGSFSSPQIDAAGGVAFLAELREPGAASASIDALFARDASGGSGALLIEGDPAPGLDPDLSIRGIDALGVNAAGELICRTQLQRPGDPFPRDQALYLRSADARLTPVAATGQLVEVRPGDFRTIAGLGVVGRPAVGRSSLGEGGRIAFLAYFEDDSSAVLLAEVSPPPAVEIDIRPWSRRNHLVPRSAMRIPVAILGSEDFDVADVDVATLAFGPAGAPPAHRRDARFVDVDRDGFVDLVSRFVVRDAGIAPGDDEACLTGATRDGASFSACDAITTLPRRLGRRLERAASRQRRALPQ